MWRRSSSGSSCPGRKSRSSATVKSYQRALTGLPPSWMGTGSRSWSPLVEDDMSDELLIAGTACRSRLLVGTGKYKDFAQTREAIVASGAQIVTVAIRRTNIGQTAGEPSLLE